jgi:hypothetical protein
MIDESYYEETRLSYLGTFLESPPNSDLVHLFVALPEARCLAKVWTLLIML